MSRYRAAVAGKALSYLSSGFVEENTRGAVRGGNTARLLARRLRESMPVAVSDTSQFNPRGLPHLTIPSRWLEDDFAAWLEERMEQRGMSQRMLALRAGVSHSSVSRLLSGDRSPSLPTALALLRVLAAEPRGDAPRAVREAS